MADYGKIKDNLCIRNPQDGDYIIIDNEGKKKNYRIKTKQQKRGNEENK